MNTIIHNNEMKHLFFSCAVLDHFTMVDENNSSTPDNALWTIQGRERPNASQRLHNLTSATSSPMASNLPLPQNIFTNPAIQPSSVINLSHSTDVVIGPMTQYQGPVSIYYMDASMEAHAMQTAAGESPILTTIKYYKCSRKSKLEFPYSGYLIELTGMWPNKEF